MSNISLVKGNIFNTKCQTVVNTVNCVGVMGKGIALVYKLRYPELFTLYKKHCDNKLIQIGKLWLYKSSAPNTPWVLNFPTKLHWKYPSKMEYLEKGLQKFVATYKAQGITSIAFPLLGAHNGGLEKNEVIEVMTSYLSGCDVPIEIYEYDPNHPDDLFETFRDQWLSLSQNEVKALTGIRKDRIETISSVLSEREVNSMIGLINSKGIGLKTMENCFQLVMQHNQAKLFN
jgi:O-acetyl-ADP-ribose deacetylase (regulator of RNase III)